MFARFTFPGLLLESQPRERWIWGQGMLMGKMSSRREYLLPPVLPRYHHKKKGQGPLPVSCPWRSAPVPSRSVAGEAPVCLQLCHIFGNCGDGSAWTLLPQLAGPAGSGSAGLKPSWPLYSGISLCAQSGDALWKCVYFMPFFPI